MKKIALTQGLFATIDDEDWELVSGYRWHAFDNHRSGIFYGMTDIRRENGKRTTLYMHRLIFNAPAGLQVDHRDGNGLNNIRSNLRLATRLENGKNRRMQSNNACGLKGVCQRKDNDKWVATIRVEGRNLHLGTFSTADEAHAAYCAASASYHGEFGRTA